MSNYLFIVEVSGEISHSFFTTNKCMRSKGFIHLFNNEILRYIPTRSPYVLTGTDINIIKELKSGSSYALPTTPVVRIFLIFKQNILKITDKTGPNPFGCLEMPNDENGRPIVLDYIEEPLFTNESN